MKFHLIVIVSLLFSWAINAQTNCYFKVDKNKILRNENLDIFIHKMQTDSFTISRDKRKIPAFVREQFNCLIDDSLLANPGEEWNNSDVHFIAKGKPETTRQLAFYAQSKDVFIIGYLQGGIGIFHHVIFMLFWDKRLVDLWSCEPGFDLKQVKNVKNILNYIQENRNKKYMLNGDYLGY
jgi:hypothetical protein